MGGRFKNLMLVAVTAALCFQTASGLVSKKERRTGLLDRASEILAGDTTGFEETLDDLYNPFIGYIEPVAQPDPEVPDPDPEPVLEEPTVERYSDEAVLTQVANKLNATSVLILGPNKRLNLSNGASLSIGDIIPAHIRGVTYEIELIDVTPDDFTLRLNTETIKRPLESRKLSGSIRPSGGSNE